MQTQLGAKQRAVFLLVAVLMLLFSTQVVVLAQNLGTAPQLGTAVLGQTGAQPEGAFLNLVNWVGNVIAPVAAGLSLVGGLAAYIGGRGAARYVLVALGCLGVSGITRLLEYWITNGGGGVS